MTEQIFNSYKEISVWAGKTNSVHLVNDDRSLPYIEKGGTYFYFGQAADVPFPAFRLVMTASVDLEAPKGEQE